MRALTVEVIKTLSARGHALTKGCDQLIVLEGGHGRADAFMHIYNSDGSEVSACGNATRCVGALVLAETGKDTVRIGTKADVLACQSAGGAGVTVDMGVPRRENAEIPVGEGVDAAHIPLAYGALTDGIAIGMGNPHVVFFVDDEQTPDLDTYGPVIEREHLEIFPERVNVSAVRVVDRTHLAVRVWERGAGFTLACGTAACAVLVAAATRGLAERKARIAMPGGELGIEWCEDGHVFMTGAVEREFSGEIALG